MALDKAYRVCQGQRETGEPVRLTRKCKEAFCVRMGAQLCCSDCERLISGKCILPCLNSPERCGMAEEMSDEGKEDANETDGNR